MCVYSNSKGALKSPRHIYLSRGFSGPKLIAKMLSRHHLGDWVSNSSLQKQQPFLIISPSINPRIPSSFFSNSRAQRSRKVIGRDLRSCSLCHVRRRVRYEEEEEEEEEYGVNEEILMLEAYSQSAKEEVLLVKAEVDGHEVEVLIFKGFSSSLSYGTSPDSSKSILPARAVIKSIDIVKGPFDPSNIECLQQGLTWEAFKSTFL